MAQRDERGNPGTALLIGPGRRARETGAVLGALSGLDAKGERRGEGLPQVEVADLEELLTKHPLAGLLILESGRVPAEDIGFVRRFLERHPGWRLVLVGEDTQAPSARALLALERAQWLPWPPDLEQLRALLAVGGSAHAGGSGALPEPKRPRQRAPASVSEALNGGPQTGTQTGVEAGVDIGGLIEELLTSAALQGEETPRFSFSSDASFLVHREREALREGLGGLIELARCCAGADGLVRAAIEPKGESVLIGLDFPRASLPEKQLAGLLEGGASKLDSELEPAVSQARLGAELLRAAGGKVELDSADGDRVRCQVRLSARPPESRGARPAKPEDPFA